MWRDFYRGKAHHFRRDILILLVIKLILLFLVWRLWFSHPQAVHMNVPADQLEQHLLTPSPAGVNHDRR